MSWIGSVVLLTVLALPTVTHAQAPPAGDTVSVGVLENWPPYYSLDASGAPTGFAVETFEVLASRAGLVPRYSVYLSFPDALAALTAGEVDMVPNLGVLETRDVAYTAPLGAFSVGFFTRASTPGSPGPGDLSGTIGVVEANVGSELLQEVAPERIIVFGSLREALFRLIAGETEGLVYPTPVVWALARQANVEDRIKETRSELAEVRRALGVTPARPDLVDRLNDVISPFIVSEEYAQLQEEWLAPPPPYWTVRRVVGLALATVALALLVLGAWRAAERSRMNRALRHRERELRDLFESIRDAIVVTDADRRIVDMNPAALELFGYGLEEIRDESTSRLYAREEDFASVGHELRRHAEEDGFLITVAYRARDGRTFSGETTAYYRRDENGVPAGFIGLIRDVTDRVEKERRATELQGQLARAQKLESVGRLAGGVAHDFNNMLTVIHGNIDLALQSLDADHPVHPELLEVRDAADRSSRLTQQLLGFARRQNVQPRVLDPNHAVESMTTMLRRMVTEDIEMVWEPCDEPWSIRIDPSQMDQILVNLVVNARDAITGGGRIVIATGKVALEPGPGARYPDARHGDYSMIAIQDDGRGIPEEILENVFEPFFTTKPDGLGTGLGLATTYGIVQQNGGFIDIESREDRGTTVRVFLPRHTGASDGEVAPAHEPGPRGAGERILLVEDDSAVLGVTARILERLGYQAVGVQSPEEALERVRADSSPFDLVVTDMVMPGMNGRELASRIRAILPDVPILFVSGYSHDVIGQPADAGIGVNLLQKPFTPLELDRKVRESLSR